MKSNKAVQQSYESKKLSIEKSISMGKTPY